MFIRKRVRVRVNYVLKKTEALFISQSSAPQISIGPTTVTTANNSVKLPVAESSLGPLDAVSSSENSARMLSSVDKLAHMITLRMQLHIRNFCFEEVSKMHKRAS